MGKIRTYTGKLVDPLNLKPEDIDIEDIGHSLAMQCRFGGHTSVFYSVAEHCCWVMEHLPAPIKLLGLLHDAAEAYIGDIATPVKEYLSVGATKLAHREQTILDTVLDALGVAYTPEEWGAVMRVDRRMLDMEGNTFMEGWVAASPEEMEGPTMCPALAENAFLRNYYELRAAVVA